VTEIKINDVDASCLTRDAFFAKITVGTILHLYRKSDSLEHIYEITGIVDYIFYRTFTVSYLYGATDIPAIGTYYYLCFDIVGSGGASGASGTGPTGPTGPVTSYIFDGGGSTNVYTLGPAFDCGTSV
jgi:hypothetical protein